MRFVLTFICLVGFVFLPNLACSKKDKEQKQEESSNAATSNPQIPEFEEENEWIEESQSYQEPESLEVPTAKSEPIKSSKSEAPAKPKPSVDPQLINQRIDTYRKDIAAYDAKLKKYQEVQNKFGGDDSEFDLKFSESVQVYEEEKTRFEELLKSLRENPSLIQWENKQREWADEWRHVVRSFNDLEALYEKQYEGLK